jgi:hypothetical protein
MRGTMYSGSAYAAIPEAMTASKMGKATMVIANPSTAMVFWSELLSAVLC